MPLADARLHAQRPAAFDDLDIDDAVAIGHAQIDRLVEPRAQRRHRRQGDLAQPRQIDLVLAAAMQPRSGPVAVPAAAVADEACRGEGVEIAERRGLRQTERARDVAEPDVLARILDIGEDGQGLGDGLDDVGIVRDLHRGSRGR